MDSTMEGVHTLTIVEAFPEDAGNYKCVARCKAGEISVISSLTVRGKQTFYSTSITFIAQYLTFIKFCVW